MKTPRFLYFDMGNVLLTFSHRLAAEQLGRLAGISAERAYEIVFDQGLHWEFERGELTRQQFHQRFCQAAAVQPPDFAEFEQAGSAIFEVNPGIVPLVTHLRYAGYRLGVLSNTTEPHWTYVTRRFYLLTYFDVQALSYQIGAMKPADSVYLAAAELAGVPPAEIFFTDDRPENVAGALAAGYDAVLFTTVLQLARDLRKRNVVTNY